MDKNLIQRLVSGLIYGCIIFLCTTSYGATFFLRVFSLPLHQSYLYYGLITFCMLVGLYECIKVTKLKSFWQLVCTLVLVGCLYYRFSYKFFYQYFYTGIHIIDIFAIVLLILVFITLFKYPQEVQRVPGKMILSVVYLTIPFGFALGLPDYLPYNTYFSTEVFMLFVLIWSSDSFAYITGRLLGKHKMAPSISPKKTWEGFIGGVVCTVALGYAIEYKFPDMKGNWIVVGFLVALFAPLGDLVESQIKRIFKVKDAGNIIPGHGGILDRLDSFMLCAPILYIYFMILTRF
ncbi:CDP-archaeol synthase [Elizabethkingia argentiflava]|uniref:Phosphatidate cytidylyltransferase n=1 Tax=Elizabethkingia argenteiflava TaxID=2681556 RepID=A0A845PZ85_9FLAO|nr:phosphatidate cytidylyltransferase [Elizabethkingia argenteiflava]NAW51678.1 CDP-archaeol synthase [Elizabethkingia argenteiflava]